MKFADFQIFREKLLRERPGVTDCAETNLYRALAHLAPPPTPAPSAKVHRCHLASEWCERFGFAPKTSRRALISCGVRDSLARISACLAAKNAALWLPSDNYPVYGELARAAGLAPREFPTLPVPQWPDGEPADGAEFLLVTNPLKPLGRGLDAADVTALETWLAGSSRRRLMLDAVYTFGTEFDAATMRLLAGGRTILLHSLTKGWLHPRLFGIALVPPEDAGRFDEAFRAAPPPQENLARTHECLGKYTETPRAVAAALREGMARMLANSQVCAAPKETSVFYYFPIAANWRVLLAERDILAMPASVFGSACDDIAILSSLTFCR